MLRTVHKLLALAAAVVVVGQPSATKAEDGASLSVLLPKLAATSGRFEALLKKASFAAEGYIEEVDGDGSGSDRKEGAVRVRYDGKKSRVDVLHYSESGEDKTAEAREKARDDEKEEKDPDDQVHMPFLTSEQPKYSFRVRATDKADPARVRIEFHPKQPKKTLLVGSAWVDTRTGEVLTMGISPSKVGMFVDYLNVTLTFGEKIANVPAVSKITFEGSGGFIFFHKKFRGMAKLWQYSVPPGS
jgi:hypothetical protein